MPDDYPIIPAGGHIPVTVRRPPGQPDQLSIPPQNPNQQQMPQPLAAWLSSITSNRYAVLGLLNVFFLIVGLFLHSAAAIILVVPIVMPLVKAVGIDPVHFGLIVTLNLGIGQQTPPVASVLMASCSIAKADMWKVTRVNLPFIGTLLATLLLVTYVPAVPMALVHFFYH